MSTEQKVDQIHRRQSGYEEVEIIQSANINIVGQPVGPAILAGYIMHDIHHQATQIACTGRCEIE